MRNTSIEAYRELENIGQKQRAVYRAIEKLGAACNLDLAHHLSWDINRVTPRTGELVELGLVAESHRAVTPRTGRKVIYWKVKRELSQAELF